MEGKAAVAMSGGVDSSVAAYLTGQMGYDTAGVILKLFGDGGTGPGGEKPCSAADDVEDARSVASALGIPFYVYDLTDRFDEKVIAPFVSAYTAGATPNPCINCNRFIKFESLMLYAQELGYDRLATGHYARTGYDPGSGRRLLKKAADPSKDQSYVLYSLTQEQLSNVLFPLGPLLKSEVREIAEQNGFANARRRESQDICFIRDGDYAGFIERRTSLKFEPGNFVDRQGVVLGTHKGIIRYTVGQHKKLGISSSVPYYVSGILPEENRIVLGPEDELYSRRLTAGSVNLIACAGIPSPVKLTAKIRYRQKEQDATVVQTDIDRLLVEFDMPQRAVTKGQSVVLYDGDVVVGGGIII